MKENEKRIAFVVLKLLYIFTILCSLLALKLELSVFLGELSRAQVDTFYMLDGISISVLILNGVAFLFFKYI